MENEKDHPEEDSQGLEEPEEDPRDRFRRLTSHPSEETPEEDRQEPSATGGRQKRVPGEEGSQDEDSPDKTTGQHRRGYGEAESQPPDEFDEHPMGDTEGSPFGRPQDDTSVMAGDQISGEPSGDTEPVKPFVESGLSSEADTETHKDLGKGERLPPPPLGDSTQFPSPVVDSEGMPLPRRVTETDLGATQVAPMAVIPSTAPPPSRSSAPRQFSRGWRAGGCFLRMFIWGLFATVFVGLAGMTFMLLQYYRIASTLPDVEDLRSRASQFETTRIKDRNGNLLYEILDPTAGRRTYVDVKDISPFMVAATIATEDEDYYSHPGFSFTAIVRAFLQNYSSGEVVSGASTITQQLARILLFDPEEAARRSYMRKVKEAILATEITRRYTKDDILEL